MKEIVIVDGGRTPIGNLGGALKDVTPQEMAATVIRELVKRNNLKVSEVDEVILGCVGQFSDAPNVARVAALLAGIPKEATAYTVQRNCSSGMQAVVKSFEILLEHDVDEQYIFEPGEALAGDVVLVTSGTSRINAIQVAYY